MNASRPKEQPVASSISSEPSQWVALHGDLLFNYAIRRVRDSDVAEELVQETLLAGLRGHEKFGGRSTERTWLFGILRRKIVDYYRTKGGSQPQALNDSLEATVSDVFDKKGKWKAPVSAWPANASESCEAKEFWAAFDKCLQKLPRSLADAFALREMEGLSGEEVCKILSITTSNLWTQLHRARMGLRHCLDVNWFSRSG